MYDFEEQKRRKLMEEIDRDFFKSEEEDEEEIIELTDVIEEEGEDLPVCTTAPAAEQARAANEDDPCDDSRSGNVEEERLVKETSGKSGSFSGDVIEVSSNLNVVSYHGPGTPEAHWNFWYDGIGIALQEKIGRTRHVVVTKNNFEFYPVHGDFDIAYIQKPRVPKGEKRPAKFIYSFVSDYFGDEKRTKEWMKKVRPDLMGCLQYCPDELVRFGKSIGCRVELVPWFVTDKESYVEDKKITAMCTGCIDNAYSKRKLIYNYLKKLNRKDVVLSCGSFGKYPLPNDEYQRKIKKTKYYFSGGIHDRFIPPKYYEVCNNGACLVSHELPLMEQFGFVDGETYVKIFNLNEINKVLDSDMYKEIGKAGREMVQKRHTVEARAKKIIEVFRDAV
jgi:hypothetical protein